MTKTTSAPSIVVNYNACSSIFHVRLLHLSPAFELPFVIYPYTW